MLTATVARPGVRPADTATEVELAARRLADAVAEFDSALDEGCAMPVLVKLDREVATATRRHHAALARAARHG